MKRWFRRSGRSSTPAGLDGSSGNSDEHIDDLVIVSPPPAPREARLVHDGSDPLLDPLPKRPVLREAVGRRGTPSDLSAVPPPPPHSPPPLNADDTAQPLARVSLPPVSFGSEISDDTDDGTLDIPGGSSLPAAADSSDPLDESTPARAVTASFSTPSLATVAEESEDASGASSETGMDDAQTIITSPAQTAVAGPGGFPSDLHRYPCWLVVGWLL